jgi:AmiR/NasT family two-component response regulator
MTTGTPTPAQDGSGAPGRRTEGPSPQDTAPRRADAMHHLSAEVDRLQRNLEDASRQSENLQAALESNRRIGMAIGILMATRRLTEDAAFDCLRRVSNVRNVKLRMLAEEVIYMGALE